MRLKWLAPLASLLALLLSAFALAACGSDSSGDSSSSGAVSDTGIPEEFAPVTAAPDDAQKGGDLTLLTEGDIDYMDPGAAYYQVTYTLDFAVFRGLEGWAPDASSDATPDLATGAPEVSDDGKTITFKIQDGVHYAPPLQDRTIVTPDIKYAIERSLLPGVANGYTSVYMGDISGMKEAEAAVKKNATAAPDISGIETPDDQTIVFHLDKPSYAGVIGALSLPVSVPVPEDYAKKYDAETPSSYADYAVFSGPYMVVNDCVDENTGEVTNDKCTGKITGYSPGKEIKLVRNPAWDPDTDFRPAYLDTITFQEGYADPTSASKKILDGDSQASGDFPPSPTVVKEIASGDKYDPSQMSVTPSGGNRYIALNTQQPPFDDLNVRKAVIANSDREALRNTRGGELFGPVMNHMIPPLIPGFEEAGGLDAPEGLDFLADVNGNPDLAAEYMKKAGFESGKCEGPDCTVTMVGDDAPPGRDTATVFQDQLEQLGFKVQFQPVEHSLMYTKFCSIPSQQPDVCPNVGWIKDFNDPQSFFDIPVYGPAINPSNNSNWPVLDDPKLNKAIEAARVVSDPEERAQTYADLDRQTMALAPFVPWVDDNDIIVHSANLNSVINLFNGELDLSFTSLKQG
jgi:peptide/nickel transport system substrate-binding protein